MMQSTRAKHTGANRVRLSDGRSTPSTARVPSMLALSVSGPPSRSECCCARGQGSSAPGTTTQCAALLLHYFLTSLSSWLPLGFLLVSRTFPFSPGRES
eukprot:1046407-Rhodomonas_salina.1